MVGAMYKIGRKICIVLNVANWQQGMRRGEVKNFQFFIFISLCGGPIPSTIKDDGCRSSDVYYVYK